MVSFRLHDQIKLREFEPEDADAVFQTVTRNYEHLKPFMHWITPDYSGRSAAEFIEQAQIAREERCSMGFGIFDGDEFIGSIGFVNFDWAARTTEMGYWISTTHEGKGIVSAACQRLIQFAVDDLEMNRVEIRCSTENLRSAAIPERLGFTREGVLRQAFLRDGKLHDFAIYGLLAAEWKDEAGSSTL
jgi:ribosomal-protein-serine acetyltransferase